MIKTLINSYGDVLEEALIKDIAETGRIKMIPKHVKMIDIGDYIKSIPLLVSGVIKILREDDNGNELLLYYLEEGNTCSMTMSCCINHNKSNIRAFTETEVQVILIPIQKMEEWMAKYESWRNFVIENYHRRVLELLTTLDNIAFKQMDERLILYLKDQSRVNQTDIIHKTHKEIAYDLHTSRVVISRLLKTLEKRNKIELGRNYIKIIHL
ncbi:Crp/Fnr family transcriptional regulator [Formosa sediminum]|uniref:Crp/Fnr family transcriptional regulator n=1 Tax=Formosa sediminum TaxID=2594004 RepID=A0A516GRQ4_9FLAO|nr:Crp/Fnr family transcriptional regulator [Formosa sediminum]QDO94050.1 Crp/Fnr family transcriptional regulator [Formosa sediminum]